MDHSGLLSLKNLILHDANFQSFEILDNIFCPNLEVIKINFISKSLPRQEHEPVEFDVNRFSLLKEIMVWCDSKFSVRIRSNSNSLIKNRRTFCPDFDVSETQSNSYLHLEFLESGSIIKEMSLKTRISFLSNEFGETIAMCKYLHIKSPRFYLNESVLNEMLSKITFATVTRISLTTVIYDDDTFDTLNNCKNLTEFQLHGFQSPRSDVSYSKLTTCLRRMHFLEVFDLHLNKNEHQNILSTVESSQLLQVFGHLRNLRWINFKIHIDMISEEVSASEFERVLPPCGGGKVEFFGWLDRIKIDKPDV